MKKKKLNFKAWHKQFRLVFDITQINFTARTFCGEGFRFEAVESSLDDIELMQPTEQVDINGRDIYEKEIVKIDCYSTKDQDTYVFIGEVMQIDEQWKIYNKTQDTSRLLTLTKENNLKVIGNIFENEDFLR